MSQRKIESHSGLFSKAVYLRALGRAQQLLSSRSATEDILRMALNKPVGLRADTDRRKYAVAAGLVQLCRGIFCSLYSEGGRGAKSRYFDHEMYRRTSFRELQRLTGRSKDEIKAALSTLARIEFINRNDRIEPTKTGWRTEVRIKPIPESVIAAHKKLMALKKPRRSPRAPKKGYKRVNAGPDSESVLINKMLALALISVRWYRAIDPLHEFLKFRGDRGSVLAKKLRDAKMRSRLNLIRYKKTGELLELSRAFYRSRMDQDLGILALSQRNDSTVMWAHYAKNHAGFCLGFRTGSTFLNPFPAEAPDIGRLIAVKYMQERPVLSALRKKFSDIFYVKDPEWSYEKEWRIVRNLTRAAKVTPGPPQLHLFEIPDDAVDCLILGMSMEREAERRLVRAFKTNFQRRPIFRCAIDATKFRLNLVRAYKGSSLPR